MYFWCFYGKRQGIYFSVLPEIQSCPSEWEDVSIHLLLKTVQAQWLYYFRPKIISVKHSQTKSFVAFLNFETRQQSPASELLHTVSYSVTFGIWYSRIHLQMLTLGCQHWDLSNKYLQFRLASYGMLKKAAW